MTSLPPKVEQVDSNTIPKSNMPWPKTKLPDILGIYEDDEYVIADIQNEVDDKDKVQIVKKSQATPILEIYPQEINFVSEENKIDLMNAYSIVDAYNIFKSELLEHFNIVLNRRPIKLAVMCDSMPSESFQNVFSVEENVLYSATQSIRNIVSALPVPGMDVIRRLIGQLFLYTGMQTDTPIDALSRMTGIAPHLQKAINSLDQNVPYIKNLGSTLVDVANMALLNNPINLPALWQNSSWDAKYTWNVRLYNPNPGDLQSTVQYVIGPLLVLLLLALPRSRSRSHLIYKPYICRFKMDGICDVKAGYISSINIIKGGNEGINIGRNQVLGVIDLVISFDSLYGILPFCDQYESEGYSNAPSLQQWVKALTAPFKNTDNASALSLNRQTILPTPAATTSEESSNNKLYKERIPNP